MTGALGFISPVALGLVLPILAALIYAYLRKKKLPVIIIPTLFLLRDLSTPQATRRKFSPPWRFWLELLVFLILVLCLAGLFFTKESSRYAIVFDNSLSMAAQKDGQQLIELQREEVKKVIAGLPSDSLFDLYQTSPHLERIGSKDLPSQALVQYLANLRPVYARDSMAQALTLVAQREAYSGIIAFTDRPLKAPTDAANSSRGVSIHRIQFEELQNIALSAPTQRDDELRVIVRSFGQRDSIDGILSLDFLNEQGAWESMQHKKFSLPAGGNSAALAFTIGKSKGREYRISLVEPSFGSRLNALAEDDQLYFSTNRGISNVQVFSLRPLRTLGIEKIRGTRFLQAKFEDYEAIRASRPNDIFLFVDYVPQGLPDRATIVVSPPQGSGGFEIGDVVSQAEISEWNVGHQLLTYIDVSTLKLSRFIPIRPPIWGTSIVSTVRGAVLVAGERSGNRHVIAGFDLFPYRGRGTPTQSVLFLNILRWVSGEQIVSNFSEPYQVLDKNIVGAAVKELGVSRAVDLTLSQSSFVPTHPGIYQVDATPANEVVHRVVNFIDEQESRLSIDEPEEGISDVSGVQVGKKIETRRQLTDYAVPILIALLCADLLVGVLLPLVRARASFSKRSVLR